MSVESWRNSKLGDVLALEYGVSLPDRLRTGDGFPVIGSGGVVGRHSRSLVNGPGVVVGRKGTVGAVIWSDGPYWPIDTTYYVETRDCFDLRWCYWLLSTLPLKRLDSSTGVPGLNRHDAYTLDVFVPPEPEQRRIADILDTVDAAIQETEALIAKLKLARAGLLHDLLTRGIDENGELRDPEKCPSGLDKSVLGPIPWSWRVCRLSELIDSAVDGPFGSNLKTEHYVSQAGVRVVRLQNIGIGQFDDDDKSYVSAEHAAALRNHEVSPGDLLVAALGDDNHPLARSCLYPRGEDPGIVKADCFRLRLHRAMAIHGYIMNVLNCPSTREDIKIMGQGVTRDRINLTGLKGMRLRVPPLAEQERIVGAVAASDAQIHSGEAALGKLVKVKKGLMQDLLTGKVRTRITAEAGA